ncbi:MAG: alginate export family protein [bacterium]
MSRLSRWVFAVAGLVAWVGLVGAVRAQEPAKIEAKPEVKAETKADVAPLPQVEVKPEAKADVAPVAKNAFRAGFDLRLREEAFDKFQLPGASAVPNTYFRIRPRIWAEADLLDNVTLRIRGVDEFRYYIKPSYEDDFNMDAPYKFGDEIVFDHIYLDIKGMLKKKLDLRIGRQDLMYGKGWVMLDGTPGDGSRTLYFNAIKATWKGIDKTTVDAFGLYNPGEDPLAIGNEDRNITSYSAALTPNDVAESGAGVYAVCKAFKIPFDTYGIYKREDGYVDKKTTNNVPAGKIGTVGFRVMPTLCTANNISALLEAAYQFGTRGDADIGAYLVEATLTYAPKVMLKPSVEAGIYMLSGDDASTKDKNEGWDPLFARFPQHSDMYVFWYSGGRWSDLTMPKLTASFWPCEQFKATAMIANLQAAEESSTGGKERGWLYLLKGEADLSSLFDLSKDALKGHLLLECLKPGDYYAGDDTAYFARWELAYTY